jgi:CubicO group peptidase (beta-lactamase class C family)
MIKRIILLVLFLSLILPAFADQLTDQVDKLFAQWDKKDSPGCALAIIKDGKIIYKRGYGMADLERDVPITSKSLFDIASTSKQFVAMSIALLAEEGKLSLDDDIRKHIPEMPDYGNKITIRHLVHHTSGIRDYCDLMYLAGLPFENDYPEAQIIELIARQKSLNFKPGEKHLYSNSGYFLLGEIVQRVSGKSLNEFTKEKIFKPLGMEITHFYDDFTRVVKNRAIGYFPKKDGGYGIALFLFDLVGDGGLLTSVEDLFLWDQNFYHNKLGQQGQKLIEQLLTPGTLNNGKKLDYAFALGIGEYKGLKMISHGGAWAGYRSQLLRFPGQQFSVICLSNLAGFNPTVMAKKVADIYLADHFKDKPIDKKAKPVSTKPKLLKVPESELKDKTGAYRNPETGGIWHIIYEEKKLKVKVPGFVFTIVPLSPLKFQAVDAPVDIWLTFLKPDKSGAAAMNVEITVEGREPVVYEPITLAAPSIDQLKEYAGNYYSEELDVTYKLFVKEDKLFCKYRYITEGFHLEPTLKDEFLLLGENVKFNRDNQGKISGFTVNTGRVQNIGFEKK